MRNFLDLPRREQKPRPYGLTHILDAGEPTQRVRGEVETSGEFIDIAKLGWGTAVLTPDLEAKIGLYEGHDIAVVLGGTLGEVAYGQGKWKELLAWIRDLGLSYVEISDGVVPIPRAEKLAMIEAVASMDGMTVLSEVGSKDPDALVAPFRWVRDIEEELRAGSAFVILEAREGGNAGVYRPNGEVRMGLIEEIENYIDTRKLIFEAPLKHQQVWLIERLGPNVNLGNIKASEAIGVETLRLGLRADTIDISVPGNGGIARGPRDMPVGD